MVPLDYILNLKAFCLELSVTFAIVTIEMTCGCGSSSFVFECVKTPLLHIVEMHQETGDRNYKDFQINPSFLVKC